jgi:antitoxin (DNA-binding transcriptional repressor) of toxin-antitoxin stability system
LNGREAAWKTITIGLGEFRAMCLNLMDGVKAKRFIVVMTKRGEPIAKMIPLEMLDSGSTAELVRNNKFGNLHAKTDSGCLATNRRHNSIVNDGGNRTRTGRDFRLAVWYD